MLLAMPDNLLPAAILKDPVTWLKPPGEPYVAMSYFALQPNKRASERMTRDSETVKGLPTVY